MQFGVILATLIVYALTIYLWWREHTPNYFVALLSSHLLVVLSPLWQALYGFTYAERFPLLYHIGINTEFQLLAKLAAYGLPWPVFWGAWVMVLPAVGVFYLFRHRWWFPSYLTSILTFVLFVLYHLLFELIGVRLGWWYYTQQIILPLGLSQIFLSALMNGVVSLGVLATLLLTRRYSLTSLLLIMLPIPFALAILVHGLLGAPLYTALLLHAQSWAGALGLLGTLGLLASGVHIIAVSLERPREWQQTI